MKSFKELIEYVRMEKVVNLSDLSAGDIVVVEIHDGTTVETLDNGEGYYKLQKSSPKIWTDKSKTDLVVKLTKDPKNLGAGWGWQLVVQLKDGRKATIINGVARRFPSDYDTAKAFKTGKVK
jgi:hypothetical protein